MIHDIDASHALGLTSGHLFCNPITSAHEIPREELADIISRAVTHARKNGAVGRDATPYILDRIRQDSAGRSVVANRALVLDNARVGALVAGKLAELDRCGSVRIGF